MRKGKGGGGGGAGEGGGVEEQEERKSTGFKVEEKGPSPKVGSHHFSWATNGNHNERG